MVNHLDSNAFRHFEAPFTKALTPALKGSASALFSDSWEIKLNGTHKIWTRGFDSAFEQRFGYDLIPFMEDSLDNFPEVRYDYMQLLSDYVIDGFYRPFHRRAHALGAFSRAQCLASPTDVMAAYAVVDVPETEAMLNNPNYARVVSSAACLAGKREVSSETFTCMYGFSLTNLREEQTADLKLVADAIIAQGVNQIFYHGMPYNGVECDTNDFFATVYIGPNGSLTEELPAFNAYLEKVCGMLKKGKTYSDVAVYIPYEDHVMAGPYPPERQRVWVWGQYEMRYIVPPREVEDRHPLWINRLFLEKAEYNNEKLITGDAAFNSLYVDVAYLDKRALDEMLRLARRGLPICLTQRPQEPGKIKSSNYEKNLNSLLSLENVSSDWSEIENSPPLLQGDSLPDYWCRVDGKEHYLFFSHPYTKGLVYPLTSGDAWCDRSIFYPLSIHANGKETQLTLEFKPYQSLMVKVDANGNCRFIDISFVPKDPVVKAPSKQRMYF